MSLTLPFGDDAEPQSRRRHERAIAGFALGVWTTLRKRAGEASPFAALARAFTVAAALGGLFCVVSTKHSVEIARAPFSRSNAHGPRPAPFVALAQRGDVPLDSDFSADNADGSRNSSRFGFTQAQRSVVDRVLEAARRTGSDPALLLSIADKESRFSASAHAATSSASGLFQFVEDTWFDVLQAFGGRHGHEEAAKAIAATDEPNHPDLSPDTRARLLKLRDDPYLSAVMAAEMLKRDGGKLAEQIGRPLTAGETYLIHFLGPDDAARFMAKLQEDPQTSAADLLPKPARANRPIFYESRAGRLRDRSVQEVHEAFEHMMGDRVKRYQSVESQLPEGVSAYAE